MRDWIVIGEIAQKHQPFHIKKWDDIVKDLSQEYPKVFNIRNIKKGVFIHKDKDSEGKNTGGNKHCIMEF